MADRYSGHSENTIDDKGRIVLPVKFREQLGRLIAIQADLENNTLKLYSKTEWDRRYEELADVPEDDGTHVKVERLLALTSEDNAPDAQWRLVLPPTLRQRVGLGRDIVISGAGRFIRIWERSAFERFISE